MKKLDSQQIADRLHLIKEKIKYLELHLSHAKAEIHMIQEGLFDFEEGELEAMYNIPGWRN